MSVSANLTNGTQLSTSVPSDDDSFLAIRKYNSVPLSSSPRQFPTDLASPILEGDETGTESPNEPITPVDVRQSQEFTTVPTPDKPNFNHNQAASAAVAAPTSDPYHQPTASVKSVILDSSAVSDAAPSLTPSAKANAAENPNHPPPQPAADQEPTTPTPGNISRRSTRGSTHSFKRSVSNLFRRTNSTSATTRPEMAFSSPMYNGNGGSETATLNDSRRKDTRADFSLNTSQTTTRSNTPPSPTSPLEMTKTYTNSNASTVQKPNGGLMPNPDDFKKNRASTGLAFRNRAVNFGGNGASPGKDKQPKRRHFGRRRSYESDQQSNEVTHHHHMGLHIEPSPWPQMADAGVGVKSRRLSISLPDDFNVEVADLQIDYEYQNKFFGRHGKHLGKGATSKVTLMSRKGFPNELYAVKEFLNKSKAESAEDYEKKVKSEYSIAKSLHHPNIVETIQLCTDHGRWNHVMEYCSDGDLFQLVEKGYLKSPDRAGDRLCLFKQVVQGVNYLHSNGIAHRDIKLENCLITNGSKLKITDFGVSEVFSGTHPGLREAGGQCGQNMCDLRLCSPGICGSEPYIAPEVLSKKAQYDPRGMDVWGSAVIMIFLTFGANIWKRAEVNTGSTQYDIFVKQWDKWNAKHPGEDARITDSDYPYFVPFDGFISPPALRRILLTMLNPDPTKRATISEIINHRWVKNIECCQVDSYDDPAKYIDASKAGATRVNGQKKIFCHNHLPLVSHGHSLGKMPGQTGY